VVVDKGYSTRTIRRYPRRRGIAHTIPERTDQIAARKRRGRLGGRPPRFDRCFNQLKQFRGLATRYDRTATSYTAVVTVACLMLWL
jgi:transposase